MLQLQCSRLCCCLCPMRRKMNEAMRMLYRGGYWLPSSDSCAIARCGLLHLRAYRRCADLSFACREPRFPIHCKAHMLHHTFRFLERHGPNLGYMESPLADSCQQDETFVGIISRYSRRVSPKSTIDRTLDLYLTALRKHMVRG